MFRFKRLNFDDFPKIYLRFKAKNLDSDDLVEYRVQDLPEDRIEDAVNFITSDQYLKDEQFNKGSGVSDDPKGMIEVREMYRGLFKEKLSLVCFKEGSNEIIALNVLFVLHESEYTMNIEFFDQFKSEPIQKMNEYNKFIGEKSDPFTPKDEYLMEGLGLLVDTKYRRRGIALKMLEARLILMKDLGLKTTITIFTGVKSQNLAKKAGYEEYKEVPYKELIANGIPIQNLTEKSAKMMGYQLKH